MVPQRPQQFASIDQKRFRVSIQVFLFFFLSKLQLHYNFILICLIAELHTGMMLANTQQQC